MTAATAEKTSTQQGPAQEAGAGSNAPAVVERIPRSERIVIESSVPMFDTAMYEHMMRIAKLMASSSLVPAHLNVERKIGGQTYPIEEGEAIANCFLVVNQAVHWKIDPFALAQHTYVNEGKLGYEGKAIAAVINSHPSIVKRLEYDYSGNGPDRKIVVTARHAGDTADKSIEGTVKQWQTTKRDGSVNAQWLKSPDQQLSYRGAREWARRHFPEIILGVFGDDEIDFEATTRAAPPDREPLQRGPAGLKQHLAQGTGNLKPTGTLEIRDQLIARFPQCSDTEVLEMVMADVRAYDWTKPDFDLIEERHRERLNELQKR